MDTTGWLTLELEGSTAERYDANLMLLLAAPRGFSLALKADAFRVRTESAAVWVPGVGNLAGPRSEASRLRAAGR